MSKEILLDVVPMLVRVGMYGELRSEQSLVEMKLSGSASWALWEFDWFAPEVPFAVEEQFPLRLESRFRIVLMLEIQLLAFTPSPKTLKSK